MRKPHWKRNASHPVSATLIFDESTKRKLRVRRECDGYRIELRIPEQEMRTAFETQTAREIYRGIIFELWQIAAERFDWEPLPPMPPHHKPWY